MTSSTPVAPPAIRRDAIGGYPKVAFYLLNGAFAKCVVGVVIAFVSCCGDSFGLQTS